MTITGKSLQALIQDFLGQHLCIERNASSNTITSYRDAIKLYLKHASESAGLAPDRLSHAILDADTVRSFLAWLQHNRGSSARTCNQRLAAIKSFARYVALVAPEHLERCRLIRELKPLQFAHQAVSYLTGDEVLRLIASIDASTPVGRRDRALILVLYNTGARVQEVVDLDVGSFHRNAIPFVRLMGKGRKQRTCPLWNRTVLALLQMLRDRDGADSRDPLFISTRGQRLSRSGIAYLLARCQRYSELAPSHAQHLSPHVIRHTTAMHLLQSGVDITTIAAWLGHARLSTTHEYVQIDLRMKQAAIAADQAIADLSDAKYPAQDIIDWLERLCRHNCYVQPKPPPNSRRPPRAVGCT